MPVVGLVAVATVVAGAMAEQQKIANVAEAEAIDLGEFGELLEKDFKVKKDDSEKLQQLVRNLALAAQSRSETTTISSNAIKSIKSLIAGIDKMLTTQVNEILHAPEVREMEVKGRNLSEGIPRSFTISSNEILEALTDPLNQIVSSVKIALEQTPPELGADIADRGMMLTGGGALLRDLDRLLMEETGLPVVVAEEPLTCVVRGCGIALERMDKLGTIFATG
jgi:hypothetical protein